MFDTLFGAEMPLAVRFFLAFLIVLGLIGATAWAVRRFGAGRIGANTRGRQPRLAVIDYASVDGRRRLILVRRDNVEHLLMIGGPTDVVVEPNIVRAVAAPRDTVSARPTAGIEALPRAIPLPENGSSGSWPLQPEPTGGPRPAPRLEPLADELPPPRAYQPHAEPPPRPQRDTLAALADELSTRPAPLPRSRPAPLARPLADEAEADSHLEPIEETHLEPVIEPRPEPRYEARAEARAEPRVEIRKPIMQPPQPRPTAAPAAAPPAAAEADQSLADMAQRLEAALRKPNAEARAPATPPRAAPAPEPTAPSEPAPRAGRPSDLASPAEAGFAKAGPKSARTETKPNQGKSALYDSLEQEMASLLGRQTKT